MGSASRTVEGSSSKMVWPLLYKKKTVAYGLGLYAFLSIIELYITVPKKMLANTGRPKDGACPSPYSYVPGDVSGPGSLDYETHSMDNITRCAELCSEKSDCQSFEFSIQNAACSFNLEHLPNTSPWQDALFCQKPLKEGEYVNPVVWGNHPDPSVLALQGGGYLSVSTSNYAFGFRNDAAFPLLYSEDLIHWTFKGHAFPGGTWPSWAYMDMWAPELHFVNGVFTLYFSGRMKTTRKLAIGVAVAKDLGDLFSGFKDLGYPLLQHSEGVIDPHFYRSDDDSNFLLWKTDNNNGGGESAIYIQQLQEDGLAFKEETEAKMILKADLPEERGVVEGPWLLHWSQYFFLLYSTGGGYADTSYSIWAARATNLTGPYSKATQPVVEVDRARYDQGLNCTFE